MTEDHSRIEVVIWDFDGTIADTNAVIVNTIRQVLAEHSRELPNAAEVRTLIGLPLAQTLGVIVPEARNDPVLQANLLADYRRIFASLVTGGVQMFNGIKDVLQGFDDQGVTQAVATGRGRASLDQLIDTFGIGRFFATLVTPEDVEHAKPDPEMVRLVCDRLGIEPGCALMIGDTSYDIEMGQQAGALTCAVTWGNQSAEDLAELRPDFLAHTPADIAKLLSA